MSKKIPVGISACLLGREVRHDGGHKHSGYCTGVLGNSFEYHPACPEMEAGLGVPRPAIRQVEKDGRIHIRETRGEADHSAALEAFNRDNLSRFAGLRGFILMQKSPSCGMERVRVYREDGELLHREGEGVFAAALKRRYPLMPVEEAGRLHDDHLLERFIERVFVYDDWLRMTEEGLTARALIEFHTRHKFQLLAHCQKTYRELGPLLADLSSDLEGVAERYIRAFMSAMARPVSRGAHVNAMLHLLGFFRDKLSGEERSAVVDQLEAYRSREVPLIVPMTLLRVAQRRFPHDYVARQHYVSPYPDHLGLRNRV